jgi:uncharacterized protein
MRWQGRRQSSIVEDRRGMSSSKIVGIGGGIGSIVIVIIVMLLGGDPSQILNLMQDGGQANYGLEEQTVPVTEQDEMTQFVSVVMADTEDVWHNLFQQNNFEYREPKLVLFRTAVELACVYALSATGPVYCVELQADFYAGIWARYAQKTINILEEGDLEEAMNAAQAVGDDRIPKQSQGYVVPDSFTHGTSAQRMNSFMLGFENGDISLGEI